MDFFNNGNAEVDELERATSAFPDIGFDGSGDIPATSSNNNSNAAGGSGFSFDDFDDIPGTYEAPPVKVTGDDEIEKFENEFPDIDVPMQVCPWFSLCVCGVKIFLLPQAQSPPKVPTYTSTTPFAPRPQPSALASTPILTQPVEEEPDAIRYVCNLSPDNYALS